MLKVHAEGGSSSRGIKVLGNGSKVRGNKGPLPSAMTTMSQYYRSGRGSKLGGNKRTRGKATTTQRVR